MKHFFKINRKKSPKPPRQPLPPEKPADIAAGPPDLRAELGVAIPDDGGRNVSDNDLKADHTDLTVPPNEGGRSGPRVLSQDWMDIGQELPASGASTSMVAICGAGYGNQLGRKTVPTEAYLVAKKTREHNLLGGAKSNTEKFGPLKVVLKKIAELLADRTGTVAVENRIAILLPRIAVLEECLDSRPSSVAEQRRRDDLIRELNSIEEQLQPFPGKQKLTLPTDHVQACEDVFRLLEDLLEAIFGYQMAQQTATGGQGFRPIDPAEADILNNVRCAQQAEYRHGGRGGCLRRTRAAILDEIELWTRDFHKPPVYWLNGLAGTGKTTIAQTIAERTFADGRLGASFFCSRDFEDRRTLQLIFPTLAVQLARKYPQFRSIFIQLIQSDPQIVHESLYGQMKKLIIQPLAESAISTVIVIDALDECKDREPASAILSVLGQFVAEVPTVKFFITGRPESRIQEGFRLPSLVESTDVFVLHEVESGQVENDIRLFFTHSFSELKRYRRGLGDWPTEEQVDVLCSRAGGLFVHAVATVRFIDHRSKSPKKQLDRLLQSQESGAFEGKAEFKDSETLDSLYTSILREAFGGDDPENDLRVRSILGAVVLAANPLSPSAIATLLSLEPEEVYPILSLVQSLLILQEDVDQPVRPFHKSFPDFVMDPARCTNRRFLVCPPVQHVELLGGCMGTMNRELERNMCKLPDGVANSEVIDLKERTEEHIGQALKYACKSWHKHLVGTIPADVGPVLDEFLEKKFLFWLEVLSVLEAAREAVDALEATTRCEWPDGSPTPNLVRDYIRFVITFFEAINVSAPHIYHSALLLSPRTSIIHEMYKHHTSPLARVVQGLPDSWERVIATATFDDDLYDAIWSPCNRFIAVAKLESVEVLDAVTLSRLSIFENSSHTARLRLSFSPDGRCLTLCVDEALISWDLQTGSPLGIIPLMPEHSDDEPFSFKHSKDGKLIAVAYKPHQDPFRSHVGYSSSICTYNNHSGRHVGSHCFPEEQIIHPIWTHNEYLRFATIDPKSIGIWQSPFTLEHPPVKVASFPVPDGITDANRPLLFPFPSQLLFLPSLSRLAFVLGDTIQLWDVKAPKLLLKSKFTPTVYYPQSSFSSDGCFFAYATEDEGVHIWKESPTGYLPYQRLPFLVDQSRVAPRLSPNAESIIISLGRKIHRLHTRDQVPSLPSIDSCPGEFTLGFSPNENFAVFARQYENTVTIIDLKSGEQKWNVDVGLDIGCVGMAGGTVIVVGQDSIVTWNLPGGGRTLNASIKNIIQTTILDPSPSSYNLGMPRYMSISPDLSHIVVLRTGEDYGSLEVDDVSTGSCLARISTGYSLLRPKFTRDGHEVWARNDYSFGEQCEIIEDGKSGTIELQLRRTEGPSREFFRESSRGYTVTGDWWVLSPSQQRLLWLPHRWRSGKWRKVWGGQFLGLLGGELSEVVLLEFLE